jgi:hypothetical protein
MIDGRVRKEFEENGKWEIGLQCTVRSELQSASNGISCSHQLRIKFKQSFKPIWWALKKVTLPALTPNHPWYRLFRVRQQYFMYFLTWRTWGADVLLHVLSRPKNNGTTLSLSAIIELCQPSILRSKFLHVFG